MARVQLCAAIPAAVLFALDGAATTGGGYKLKVPQAGQLAAINTTVYAGATGGSTIAAPALVTNSSGELPGYVEEGSWELTLGATVYHVEAVSGASMLALESDQADLAAEVAAIDVDGLATIEATVLETTDTTSRALEVFTTNPLSDRKERFVIENNQDTPEIDINFRNCTVNFGDPDEDISMAGAALFFQPLGGTQSPIQVAAPGENASGHKVFFVTANGAINLGVHGLSSVAIRVNGEGEANDRYWLGADGEMRWGPGGATALDTSLKRLQAGTLQLGQIGASGALEVQFVSTEATIRSYDRGASAYRALILEAASVDLAPNNTTKLKVNTTGIGFYGTTPIAKRGTTADATDLATVIALANALKADLQAYGLKA